jgi:hypothetical protein
MVGLWGRYGIGWAAYNLAAHAPAGIMEVLPFILIAVVLGAAIYLGARAKRKRREMLQRVAAELGGQFHEKDPFGLAESHERHFGTLRTGSRRYALNVVQASRPDGNVWLFDHHYETYSHNKNGRQTHHHFRTFALFETELQFHAMDVRPEGMFDKLKAAFGYDDIDFESAEFSRKWMVSCDDRKFAFDVFHPKMIEYFLRIKGLHLHTAGPYVMLRTGSGRMDENEIRTVLGHAREFLAQLPRYLRKDHAR